MEHILHKTLIIRFSSVGDIVLSTLLIRTLRKRYPGCQIEYVVKADYADLLRHNPHLTRVIEFPSAGSFSDLARLRRAIRLARYDLIIDLHDSLRSRFLCFGLQHVVRYNKRKVARFLLVRFKWDLYRLFGGAPSVAHRYLETLQPYGVVDDDLGLELVIPSDVARMADSRLVEAKIRPGTPLIAVCPSARHATKIWPGERFGFVAATVAREQGGAVLLFGSSEERPLCNEVERSIRQTSGDVTVVNMAGTLPLGQTTAIIDRCVLVLCNDSGLMHIAAARKRRILAVFGSTVRQFGFFPFGTVNEVVEHSGLACRPCTSIGLPACPRGHFKCMKDITVDHALAAARRLLAA